MRSRACFRHPMRCTSRSARERPRATGKQEVMSPDWSRERRLRSLDSRGSAIRTMWLLAKTHNFTSKPVIRTAPGMDEGAGVEVISERSIQAGSGKENRAGDGTMGDCRSTEIQSRFLVTDNGVLSNDIGFVMNVPART